jgi:hypothetical protein
MNGGGGRPPGTNRRPTCPPDGAPRVAHPRKAAGGTTSPASHHVSHERLPTPGFRFLRQTAYRWGDGAPAGRVALTFGSNLINIGTTHRGASNFGGGASGGVAASSPLTPSRALSAPTVRWFGGPATPKTRALRPGAVSPPTRRLRSLRMSRRRYHDRHRDTQPLPCPTAHS